MVVKSSSPRPAPADEALYEIIRHVRPLHRVLAKAVEDRLEGTGITVGMRAVLERLHDEGPQTVPQIGRSLGIGRQFIQRLVNSAFELGLMEAVQNPEHARSSLIALTPEGEATIRRIRDREQKVLKQVAKKMKREDISAALRVIAELTKEFRAIAQEDTDHE